MRARRSASTSRQRPRISSRNPVSSAGSSANRAASASWSNCSVRQAVAQTTVVEYRRGARNPDQPMGVHGARLRPTSMSSLPSSMRFRNSSPPLATMYRCVAGANWRVRTCPASNSRSPASAASRSQAGRVSAPAGGTRSAAWAINSSVVTDMPGYDSTTVRGTRPPLTRPNDFDAFWAATLERLARTPANPRLGMAVTTTDGNRITPIRFASLDGADIQGFFIAPEAVTGDRPRPLVITTHGYNSHTNPVLDARHVAASGADLLGFDIRGFGLSGSACAVESDGYILTGIDDPRTSILRGAVCDYVRAAEVGALLQAGGGGTVFHGRSFGAALAIMAQAVAPRADYLVAAVPTLGWAAGRRRLATGGSTLEVNEFLARRPAAEAAVMRTLAYFDTVNYAERVACDALVGVGLRDTVVPPATVYAITNHMTPQPEIMELPVSHTDLLEERHWVQFDSRWTSRIKTLT